MANRNSDCKFQFVEHKIKFTETKQYRYHITAQNKFLDSQRVIPIVGINKKAMITNNSTSKSIKLKITQSLVEIKNAFLQVVETDKTAREGRWNVLVDLENFDDGVFFLMENLLSLCSSHPDYKSDEFLVPDAQVQFNNYTPASKDARSKDNTYLNTVGDIDENKYASPPNAPPKEIKWDYASTDSSLSSEDVPKKGSYKNALSASLQHPKVVTATNTMVSGHTAHQSHVSNITSEAKSIIDDLRSQNATLRANQEKLERQLAEMHAQHQKNHNDLTSTMTAFMTMMAQQHIPPPPKKN